MSESCDLAELLASTAVILLDFDGPVCSVFAGHPAHLVADELRERVRLAGATVPRQVAVNPDPLAVLAWAGTLGRPDVTRQVDDALRSAELVAVASASPTPHVDELIGVAGRHGIKVAIVSNNSAPAVRVYLERHGFDGLVTAVIGRAYGRPDRMKPHPEPLLRAIDATSTAPSAAVMIGDSVTDIAAASTIGARSVGFANKPGKVESLHAAHATVVVESIADVVSAIRGNPP